MRLDMKMLSALVGKDVLPIDTAPYKVPGGISYALDVRERRAID